jgi:hypothetical protein
MHGMMRRIATRVAVLLIALLTTMDEGEGRLEGDAIYVHTTNHALPMHNQVSNQITFPRLSFHPPPCSALDGERERESVTRNGGRDEAGTNHSNYDYSMVTYLTSSQAQPLCIFYSRMHGNMRPARDEICVAAAQCFPRPSFVFGAASAGRSRAIPGAVTRRTAGRSKR